MLVLFSQSVDAVIICICVYLESQGPSSSSASHHHHHHYQKLVVFMALLNIQWNLPKMDTIGTEPCVSYVEDALH